MLVDVILPCGLELVLLVHELVTGLNFQYNKRKFLIQVKEVLNSGAAMWFLEQHHSTVQCLCLSVPELSLLPL